MDSDDANLEEEEEARIPVPLTSTTTPKPATLLRAAQQAQRLAQESKTNISLETCEAANSNSLGSSALSLNGHRATLAAAAALAQTPLHAKRAMRGRRLLLP